MGGLRHRFGGIAALTAAGGPRCRVPLPPSARSRSARPCLRPAGCARASCSPKATRWPRSPRRWAKGGVRALHRRRASGRPPKLSDEQVRQIEQALLAGALANGFDNDLWTLRRVAQVVERTSGMRLTPASVWRLLGNVNSRWDLAHIT